MLKFLNFQFFSFSQKFLRKFRKFPQKHRKFPESSRNSLKHTHITKTTNTQKYTHTTKNTQFPTNTHKNTTFSPTNTLFYTFSLFSPLFFAISQKFPAISTHNHQHTYTPDISQKFPTFHTTVTLFFHKKPPFFHLYKSKKPRNLQKYLKFHNLFHQILDIYIHTTFIHNYT